MIKRFRHLSAVIVSLIFLTGCNLLGPSEKDVTAALEAAMRGFADSMEVENPEVQNSYSNAADFIFRNEDQSLVHQMRVHIKDDEVSVAGDCKMAEYEDYDSDYLVSGNLVYELLFPKNRFPNAGFGIMEGELTLSGGKVETIEFSLSLDEDGQLEEFLISANGKEIDLSEQDSMYDLFRQISGRLPG